MAGEIDLDGWIKRVQKCTTIATLLETMAEFRKLGATDEDSAKVAKAYMRVMERVGHQTAASGASADAAQVLGNDGPVWYEKM